MKPSPMKPPQQFVKLDVCFYANPKVMTAGKDAGWLYVIGLCYSKQHLLDGFVPAAFVSCFLPGGEKHAQRLVDIGLWNKAEGGWLIHDYSEWQQTAEQVEAARKAKAEAGQKGGVASGVARSKTEAKPKQTVKQNRSKTEANAKQVLEQNEAEVEKEKKDLGLITYDYAVVSDAGPPSEALSEMISEEVKAQDGEEIREETERLFDGVTSSPPGGPSSGDDEAAWDQLRGLAWGSGRPPGPPPRPGPVSLGDALRVVTREAQGRRSHRGR